MSEGGLRVVCRTIGFPDVIEIRHVSKKVGDLEVAEKIEVVVADATFFCIFLILVVYLDWGAGAVEGMNRASCSGCKWLRILPSGRFEGGDI